MPRFMDFHADLKLPSEAIAQIADDTRNERADQFGVRQVELYHNADGQVYCLLDGPDEDAIRGILLTCLEAHYDSLDKCIAVPERAEGLLRQIREMIEMNGF